MAVFLVSEGIKIQSHKGEYGVSFMPKLEGLLGQGPIENSTYIIDKKVAELYGAQLNPILDGGRVLQIEANEESKSLDQFPGYIDALVALNVRRGQPLVAIGGGITQDITCFIAATMMRGLPWIFYPTTLLAQSDSCVGSKSSINSGSVKNILGTFTPPEKVVIDVSFLGTLEKREIFSGIGEMLKVHAIDSPESFDHISSHYERILAESDAMEGFIYDSLLMKKKLIEVDEFDQGPRNVMNYGHSFGHAIESATHYAVPHGIAVTIGMDLANYVAMKLGVSNSNHFERMHGVLDKNCELFRNVKVDIELLMDALVKDKKNSATQLKLILPDQEGRIGIGFYDNDEHLIRSVCQYFDLYGGGECN
jgi:3-dehydroquinate synthase